MELLYTNPYVRFARVQKNIPSRYIVGVDHRIFFCVYGEGEITVKNQTYSMKPNTFLLIKAGIPYRNTSQTKDMVVLAYNFDFFCKEERMGGPVSYVEACNYRPCMLLEQEIPENLIGPQEVMYLSGFYKKEQLSLQHPSQCHFPAPLQYSNRLGQGMHCH